MGQKALAQNSLASLMRNFIVPPREGKQAMQHHKNITELIAFHKAQNVKATLTATIPPGRFGALDLNGSKVNSFMEKPKGDGAMINGGFFVLSPKVIDYITDDTTTWEREPLERLAQEGNLAAYQHHGFWQPMDTLRDKIHLEELWQSGKAPWKVWS